MGQQKRKKAVEVKIEARRVQVLANLLAGLSYRPMAEALGVSVGTIAEDVKVVLARLRSEQMVGAEEWRALEVRRLTDLQNAIWREAMGHGVEVKNGDGDTKVMPGNQHAALDRAVRIIVERSKFLPERPTIIEIREERTGDTVDLDTALVIQMKRLMDKKDQTGRYLDIEDAEFTE